MLPRQLILIQVTKIMVFFFATANTASPTNPDIRSTTASSGYLGASGGGNIFIGTGGTSGVINDRQVSIVGINTASTSNLRLTFGVTWQTANTGTDLILEQSSNGGANWSVLNFTAPVFNSWILATVSGTIFQTSNLALRFTRPGNVRGYRLDDINLVDFASSASNSITGFTLANTNAIISGNLITVTVPSLTNLSALSATGVISNLASVNPAFSSFRDYSSSVLFTVTAQNFSTNIYTVTAFVAPVNVADNFITSFSVQNQASSTITGNDIFVSFPNATLLNSFTCI